MFYVLGEGRSHFQVDFGISSLFMILCNCKRKLGIPKEQQRNIVLQADLKLLLLTTKYDYSKSRQSTIFKFWYRLKLKILMRMQNLVDQMLNFCSINTRNFLQLPFNYATLCHTDTARTRHKYFSVFYLSLAKRYRNRCNVLPTKRC